MQNINFDSFILDEDLEYLLEFSSTIWSKLDNKKIFLTGSSGFLGRNFLSALFFVQKNSQYKFEITSLIKNVSNFYDLSVINSSKNNFKVIEGGLEKLTEIKNEFDLIIHLADQTATHEIYTDYNLFTITKEEILKRSKENISYVIEFIKNNKVKHLIYVSSGAVYESAINENRLLETDKVMSKPGGRYYNYSINKLLTEKIIREELIKYNVKFYNLRGFTFAGPHLNLDKKLAFAEFFRNCLNNRDIHIGGNPESKRSYMYSYEFVIWCLKLFANNSHSGCYNIGSTEETTILNLAQSIKDITKSNIKITTTNELLEKNYYIPNIDLLEKEIGLTQRIMFQQIVERYYKWIKKAL